MDVLGIAPFFANTDLSRHGEVIVSESTKGDILAKANQVINDNLESGDFTATSVVIVSYMNVSAPNTDVSYSGYKSNLIALPSVFEYLSNVVDWRERFSKTAVDIRATSLRPTNMEQWSRGWDNDK